MKHLPTLRHGLLALSLGLAALPALADDDCDAPVQRWQPREAVRQMAARRGWDIQQIKIDDGCYAIRGKDAEGRTFKAKIDPETLHIVKMKRRDHERNEGPERERRREREHRATPTPAQGNADPSSVFTPGTAPRGQVE